MGLFSFLWGKRRGNRSGKAAELRVERLEDRTVPSCNTISGYVFQDANNNGLFDPGELPIANVPVELRNAQGVAVAGGVTDANGFYQFDHDQTVNTSPTSMTRTVTFPATQTNFSLSTLVDQFNPALGQLRSIEITHEGSITSAIKVENTSTTSASTINGTVSGTLALTGPGGLVLDLSLSANAGSFSAATYDGAIDFTGPSGSALAPRIASSSKTVTLTGPAMQAFLGTGTVLFTEKGEATSTANGGGNLVMQIESTGTAKLTVKYNYIPDNCLDPGDYTLRQVQEPAGFIDGKESRGGVVLNNPPGISVIAVTLSGADLTHNDFGELRPPSLSGYVYHDINNNGLRDGPEQGIAGVTVTLTGTDDFGPVNKTATTNGTGLYEFSNLRPGTYTVNETQPATWLDGKDTLGNIPGTTSNDRFANIVLGSGTQSINNNFGELKPSSLSGFVYADANNNGVKDPSEAGIANVQITLSDTAGLQQTRTTDANGAYQFNDLLPGTYTLRESQPATHLDGKDAIGSQGGAAANDQLSGIVLLSGGNGVNYNFGELTPAGLSGFVFEDTNKNSVRDPGEPGIANVSVALGGSDDLGTVNRTAATDSAGAYAFANLRPGTYTLSETQPPGYEDGQDTLGNQGGSVSNDQFGNILLAAGAHGANYNFGEIKVEKADLGVAKTASPSILVGGSLTYEITVTNHGDFTAKNVSITDTLPADVTLLTATGPGWSFTLPSSPGPGGMIVARTPTLPVGVSSKIFVTVQAPVFPGSVTNTVDVTATTPDNNPTNNHSEATTLIYSQPGETFLKTILPLAAGFGVPIVGKNQLFNDSAGLTSMDATLKGNLAFVSGLYTSLLGRNPDYGSHIHYANQLSTGAVSREQLVSAFWYADEHHAIQADAFFRVFYQRTPTASERAVVVNQLRAGVSETNVALGFLTSAEYQNSHPTPVSFVTGFYTNVVGKVPDLSSQLLFLQGTATDRVTIARALLSQTSTLQSIVDESYRAVLRRQATASELAFWTAQMQSGQLGAGDVIRKLMASGEFFNIALTSAVVG